jgi:hypothetical protein
MSRPCSKGESTPHDKQVCSKNYDGGSKGMEAYDAVENVNSLFPNKCYVKTSVMDDDASTKSMLRWSYKTAKELYDMEWPTTKANNKKRTTEG